VREKNIVLQYKDNVGMVLDDIYLDEAKKQETSNSKFTKSKIGWGASTSTPF
jgi:hypothetical protein